MGKSQPDAKMTVKVGAKVRHCEKLIPKLLAAGRE